MENIDFVIIWVDGNDPEWQAERNKYKADSHSDNRIQRFRDWDNLMYWFRGVEKFAPWVNKIHFVTWGHLPEWLNTEHPKLNVVKHSDYIPEKYLPTFSSHTIELNIHRIKGLSENFVYFNDDMFIIAPVEQEVFFKNGLPCDSAVLNAHCYSKESGMLLSVYRDIGIINKYFNMKDVIKSNPFQWLNLKYGKELLRTVVLLPCPRFPGIWQHHLPTSFRKTTLKEVWDHEYAELDETCIHKFRYILDYNQWLFREWQIAKGEFFPRRSNIGKSFILGDCDNVSDVCKYITRQKSKMICINDGKMSEDEFNNNKRLVNDAFKIILPDKSSFEK